MIFFQCILVWHYIRFEFHTKITNNEPNFPSFQCSESLVQISQIWIVNISRTEKSRFFKWRGLVKHLYMQEKFESRMIPHFLHHSTNDSQQYWKHIHFPAQQKTISNDVKFVSKHPLRRTARRLPTTYGSFPRIVCIPTYLNLNFSTFQIRQIEVRVSLLVFVRCFCFVYVSLFAVCSSFEEEVATESVSR